jgi:hypothetical protein
MFLRTRRIGVTVWLLLLTLVISLAGCSKKSENASVEKPSVKVFASPDDAGAAVMEAAKSGDQNALLAIFGPESKELIYSGDPVEDKAAIAAFAAGYQQMHRWRKTADNSQTLLVGAVNFPFPIPLKKNNAGQWFFDTAAGKEEVLARRIGRNELAVINASAALANAQAEYFSHRLEDGKTKEYAVKFISDPGKHDGLYWDSSDGQPAGPLGPLAAVATQQGYSLQENSHAPFHGYQFRMLTRQGSHAKGGAKDYMVNGKMVDGFAFVAYPAEYRNSGVMTFIMNQDGVLYQKDLGKDTKEVASTMSEFDPGDGWTPVGQ